MVLTLSRVSRGPDGGYKGIVVRIDSQVDQDLYPEIIDNIKVKKSDTLRLITMPDFVYSFFPIRIFF